jgi:uncharacterized protein YxjI
MQLQLKFLNGNNMRLFKGFIIGLIGLFLMITLLSLLIPSNIKVSRTVIINDTTGKIIAQVKDIKNWGNWHPIFACKDATINYLNNGCDIVYNNKTTHLVSQSATTKSVKFLLKSDNENDIANEILIIPIEHQNAMQVEWQANVKLHWYPWEKFYGIFIDKLTGPGYEAALNGLKKFIETPQ